MFELIVVHIDLNDIMSSTYTDPHTDEVCGQKLINIKEGYELNKHVP